MNPLVTVLLIAFSSLIVCDPPTTTKHPDIETTLKAQNTHILNRVEKKAQITYQYVLNGNNRWTQYPDMALSFSLPFDQYVLVDYKIIIWTGKQTHIVTRVMIDGVENREFRFKTGNTYFQTNADYR